MYDWETANRDVASRMADGWRPKVRDAEYGRQVGLVDPSPWGPSLQPENHVGVAIRKVDDCPGTERTDELTRAYLA